MNSKLIDRYREKIQEIVKQFLFYVDDGRPARSMMTKEVNLTNFVENIIKYATETNRILDNSPYKDIDICNEYYFVDRGQMTNFALKILHVMKELNPLLNITYEMKRIQPQTSTAVWLYFTIYSDENSERLKRYEADQDDFYEDYETDKEMSAKLIRDVRRCVRKLQERLDVLRGMS